MPRYSYQSAPGLRIRTTHFAGSAEEFAQALAEDCRADYGTEPDVRVWDGPITEPPAATAR
ncbi:hypothetical protein [Saccharothrix sp. ST-888]|uniref:hypothetical protein n=1 Tax=Saccharothrix sp. ST-888 TaxID=1427391 RepID=UPI0005EBF693|nr:hypothetical protein [Saccharothrix sp. ST-888]KJK58342.1 hypothetical protein UK12_11165 [Saccharothrix sp. ST-888]